MCNIIIDFISDQQFWRNIISALVGTGTALLVFSLTTKRDQKKEKEKKEEEIDNRIINFLNLLNSSKTHALTTIENLSEMIRNYDRNLLDFQLLRFSPNKSFERLDDNLKNENYFQAFVRKYGSEKIPNYNTLSSIIDYFSTQNNHLWDMIKKAQEQDYIRKTRFNDMSRESIDDIARLTIDRPSGFSDDEVEIISQILVEYHVNMTNTLTYNYIYLRKFLEEGLRGQISNLNVNPIIKKIKDASQLFNEISFQNEHHKNNLVTIRDEMQFSLNQYVLEIRNLQN